MHIDAVPNRGSRPAYLLRESFRAFHAGGIALILAGVTLAGASAPAERRSA